MREALSVPNARGHLLPHTSRIWPTSDPDKRIEHTRHAGLGPYPAVRQTRRLHVLTATGQDEYVLDQVAQLREHMDGLPHDTGQRKTVGQFNVREGPLHAGREAAVGRVGDSGTRPERRKGSVGFGRLINRLSE